MSGHDDLCDDGGQPPPVRQEDRLRPAGQVPGGGGQLHRHGRRVLGEGNVTRDLL